MNEKERELRQELANVLEEARSATESGKLDEARKHADKAKELRKQLDLMEELRNMKPPKTEPVQESRGEEDAIEYRDVFMKGLRNKSLTGEEREVLEKVKMEERAMSGLTEEDGNLIIPQDIQTKINELSRSFDALEPFVTVEPVNTRSGSRVLEKNADMVPFAEVDEMGLINETDNPKFGKLNYAVKDRAGILPLSRSLLQDSDQNIIAYVTKWLGKKSKITRNSLILEKLKALKKKTLKEVDDIKDVLNVDLDPAISAGAIILTNQDGYNHLDKLKDNEGKYLLQPDPTQSTRKTLFGKSVVVVSNRFLSTTAKKAPCIIGDLKEAIVLFKREQMELASTETGGDAFKRNTLDVRAIQRDDVQLWDDQAAVFGELDLTAKSTENK
ncbi:phage major capsid protein [Brevibacillus laterosporus]|uniref:Phage major capsid protein n=1 Tax=Brevibacillus halotolerans TaxID=1507437 RepID=A0ABT4HZ33_9BACL|nr:MULTISPECIES: phage major capsid protein [Brevibacillus]MCR8985993.1 phage major capsid protein [Brevibacillus laterosporus]MCZ0831726.1 phage major capsid protein [Brevibacillus halotolerans]